ncbi:MAG: GAF domain-containing protein [Nostoc sp.]
MKTCQVKRSQEVTNFTLFSVESDAFNKILENLFDFPNRDSQSVMIRAFSSQQCKQIGKNPLTAKELCILEGDRLWGLLIAHHCTTPREWQSWESKLLQQLATQIAIAIQQSELYQKLQLANQQLENIAMVDQLTQIILPTYLHTSRITPLNPPVYWGKTYKSSPLSQKFSEVRSVQIPDNFCEVGDLAALQNI